MPNDRVCLCVSDTECMCEIQFMACHRGNFIHAKMPMVIVARVSTQSMA